MAPAMGNNAEIRPSRPDQEAVGSSVAMLTTHVANPSKPPATTVRKLSAISKGLGVNELIREERLGQDIVRPC